MILAGCPTSGPTRAPRAAFGVGQNAGPAPISVQFTNLSIPGDAPIVEWIWDLGDGTRSSERNPSHTYETPGLYDVQLSAIDSAGKSHIAVQRGLVNVANNDPTFGNIELRFDKRSLFLYHHDIDGDGTREFVLPDANSSSVSMVDVSNLADITSFDLVISANQTDALDVAFMDIDRDNLDELAVISRSESAIRFFSNEGGGAFTILAGDNLEYQPNSVDSADFNRDGIDDLIINTTGYTDGSEEIVTVVDVYLGTDNGRFNAADRISSSSGNVRINIADVSGDGALDIMVADMVDPVMSTFLGIGNGRFSEEILTVVANTDPADEPKLTVIDTFDLDNDGDAEVIVPGRRSGTIAILDWNHAGYTREDIVTGSNMYVVRAGDMNGDGLIDLVVSFDRADPFGFGLNVILRDEDGTWDPAPTEYFMIGTRDIVLDDINGDGKNDIVALRGIGSSSTSFLEIAIQE
jgi:PKD repeat protein